MRRLLKSIKSKLEKPYNELIDEDLTSMKASELRALAARMRREIQSSSAMLARVESQVALVECGRVHGRALSLQQRLHPPVLSNPNSGSSLGDDLQLFYDGEVNDLTVRQRQFSESTDDSPFPLEVEMYSFDGSFLSIVQNLPGDLVQGASEQDLIELSFAISSEHDCGITLRLNIRHGPNDSQLSRSCRTESRRQVQSFDLAEAALSHRAVERIWVDVIFSDPAMNRIVIADLIVRRRARAQV